MTYNFKSTSSFRYNLFQMYYDWLSAFFFFFFLRYSYFFIWTNIEKYLCAHRRRVFKFFCSTWILTTKHLKVGKKRNNKKLNIWLRNSKDSRSKIEHLDKYIYILKKFKIFTTCYSIILQPKNKLLRNKVFWCTL